MFKQFQLSLFKGHLLKGEQVLLILRDNIKSYMKSKKGLLLFGIILPLLLWFFLPTFYYVWLFWIGIVLLRFVYTYYSWFRDAWLLTNMGFLKVKWNGPYKLKTMRIDFPDIAEVMVDQQGIIHHFSGIGNIQITLNNGDIITLKNQANPNSKVNLLMDIRREFLRQNQWGDDDSLKDILSQIVGKYMREGGIPFRDQKTKPGFMEEDDIVIEVVQKTEWKVD